MKVLDPRLHAFREDIADEQLRGRVEAARFVAGRPARIVSAVADVHAAPDLRSGVNTQFLHGMDVTVFEQGEEWAWVQADYDGYVGYVLTRSLGEQGPSATHIVQAARTFVYPEPELKLPRAGEQSMGALVTIVDFFEKRGTRYAILPDGAAMIASHLKPIGEAEEDYVSAAERLIYAPYLWGGTSGFGIDCSGLVQLAMRMAGKVVLRDSDMQAASTGEVIEPGRDYAGLRRGDLVFWKGHVAIMASATEVLHANGSTMMVSHEPLSSAIGRIEPLFGKPIVFRRP
ncbi:cell wall-associated NlpC family hydrolase [Mesorhizobium sp. J18]|uniref:C40 family peptidase n=1 Tax=Mesorhizobium sp. J18 TaxID=935263 RepID=UPI00119AE0E7|nr:NlpC/P60 family protein [Mesorhizobium sp. J18]TWG92343.1 cell wall-associated NlpC family hydrolase [Mesorhizobium sp. J18]